MVAGLPVRTSVSSHPQWELSSRIGPPPMTDTFDRPTRSAIMSRIRSRHTKPEMIVRRVAHRLGYRFRLHRRELPGSPDLVSSRHRVVIMVHGCFWHRHPGCKYASTPKTRVTFWEDKFAANVVRDSRNMVALDDLGWRVMVIWECETNDRRALADRIDLHFRGRIVGDQPESGLEA